MINIYDANGRRIRTSKNLRGILEYTRTHTVERVDIWPGKSGAQFGIAWCNGSTAISDFADVTVCKAFFAKRAQFAPFVVLHS